MIWKGEKKSSILWINVDQEKAPRVTGYYESQTYNNCKDKWGNYNSKVL